MSRAHPDVVGVDEFFSEERVFRIPLEERPVHENVLDEGRKAS